MNESTEPGRIDIDEFLGYEDDDSGKEWFVIHTYSGYENKVKANLERRVESMGMEDKIFRVLVPIIEEIDFKDGKKRIAKKKVFPGYVLVEMIMSDDSWYVVRNTPGVTGFVGSGSKPIPLDRSEVKAILKQMGFDEGRPRVAFAVGDHIRVSTGPFANFDGHIAEVDIERGKVRVVISMFGRETPIELDFEQIEKLS
ncbi:MAG TPA: transcription termination/antitermination protein NusG [Firmicutes bacterium]|jgi:transcriptional antiterminator NusG|nr:transcription termination/antitermination protein NusG [Bacillota bacterium]